MTSSIESLESRLLKEPFNSTLRSDYADALLKAGRPADALAQYELCASQTGAGAACQLGAARALLALERIEEARARYTQARDVTDFSADTALENELGLNRITTHEAPRLSLVSNEPADNVVPISVARRDSIRFADIAGMDALKKTVRLQIIEPFLRPGLFARFRKRAGGGILLYGPPGCGKTMLARAVATECRAEFIPVGISDILSAWLGESERNLKLMFERARASKPAVLFFDELDALAFARSKSNTDSSRKVVNEFLSQLDGFAEDNNEVLILAATNMPWDVDGAMKRPGRFSRQIFVPPPDATARARLFELKLAEVPTEALDLQALANACPQYSGADIEGAIDLAKEHAILDYIDNKLERNIRQDDLLAAIAATKASTLDWMRTARNLVVYAGADDAYSEVGSYLKQHKLL